MITVLATNAYKAAYKVRKAATPVKSLPVSSHILIRGHAGELQMIPFRFEERIENAVTIPARTQADFATCVPARAFVDWLHATMNPKKNQPDQIEMTLDAQTQILRIRAGNTRAEFKCIDAQEFPPC